MTKLDRTEQRIVGVLIEKQLTVPDTYPLSENAVVNGCNQSNNRDPVLELVPFQVAGALMSLQHKEVVSRIEGAGRVAKYRHNLEAWLAIAVPEQTVLAELLLRGPQAPGALKPRVARMGYHASPEQIDQLLRVMAERKPALVEQLSLRPRERDRRWRHLLGDGSEGSDVPSPVSVPATQAHAAMPAVTAAASEAASPLAELRQRIESLERTVQQLQDELQQLRSAPRSD